MDYELKCANLNARLRKSMIAPMLLIALCVTSCKTVQSATQTTHSEQKEQTNDVDCHTDVQTAVQTTLSSSDTGVIETEVDETTEETIWSIPDSSGVQHPVKTTVTKRHTSSGKKNNVQTNSTSDRHAAVQYDANDNTQTKTTTDDKTDSTMSTKTSTPAWIIWLIIGIFAVIVTAVLVVLKHYHIV